MALHLHIGPLKPSLGWSRNRDAKPVPTSPLADDLASSLSWASSLDFTLFQIGKTTSPQCAFCGGAEDVEHVLLPCRGRGLQRMEGRKYII